ncbi:MAG: cytochrome b5-like heme/steroid binding domain-containing protein [Patescibacteria group bacterium]|jgi:cytochrome b involved in lipid metabolism
MKKENIIGIIGTILVIGLVAYFSVSYFDNKNPIVNSNINGSNSADNNMLTEASVATHNAKTDCWLIINNKVYDVTDYLRSHPGGQAIVLPYCGKDATQAFDTKAGQGSHSQNAIEQLGALYVGDLNQNNIVVTNSNANSNTNSSVITVNSAVLSFSTALVAEHSTPTDCWLIIDSGVYDVSNYLISHPGGQSIIIPYCGKDATQAFATQGGQGSHSSFASSQLSDYRIGTIGSATTIEQIQQAQEQVPDTTTTNTNTQTVTVPNNITITTTLVTTHNTSGDCWIIVGNNVYAVSGYLNSHPGGSSIIIPYCGKDATQAFNTQGGQGSHSSFASSQLSAYLIGALGTNITEKSIEQIQTNINQTPPSDSSEDEEEEDQEDDNEEEEEDD